MINISNIQENKEPSDQLINWPTHQILSIFATDLNEIVAGNKLKNVNIELFVSVGLASEISSWQKCH